MFARHDIFRLTTVINNNIAYLRPETMFFTVRPQSNFSSQILRKEARSFDTPALKCHVMLLGRSLLNSFLEVGLRRSESCSKIYFKLIMYYPFLSVTSTFKREKTIYLHRNRIGA